MKYLSVFVFLTFLIYCSLSGHEGHHESSILLSAEAFEISSWMQSIGRLHLILLHFPIALIGMTVVAEILLGLSKKPIYDFAARFMLLSAALLVFPTLFCGYLLRYSTTYQEPLATYIWWHMIFGTASAFFTPYVAYLRESQGISRPYFLSLALLFILVNVTGLFGGWVAF